MALLTQPSARKSIKARSLAGGFRSGRYTAYMPPNSSSACRDGADECARAQIVRDDEGRLINDSLACDRRGTERITIVGAQSAADLNERSPSTRTANGRLLPFATACSRGSYVLKSATVSVCRSPGGKRGAAARIVRQGASLRAIKAEISRLPIRTANVPAFLSKIDLAVVEPKLDTAHADSAW